MCLIVIFKGNLYGISIVYKTNIKMFIPVFNAIF